MLGLQYLYKSGYDPLGMVDIFEKIVLLRRTKARLLARALFEPPDIRRPPGERAEEYRDAIEGPAGVHRQHLRVRQRQGPSR